MNIVLRFLSICGLLNLWLGAGCTSVQDRSDARPQIYDSRADGEQQLSAALMQAREQHKRVLLNLGANWCSDSQATYRLLQTDPAIRQELRQHFVLAMVDVNERDGPPRNRSLVERFGNPLARGIPVLLVLGSHGELLNKDPAERLGDDSYKVPARVLAYLRKWAPSAP